MQKEKKIQKTTLRVHSETIRNLNLSQLKEVAGAGGLPTYIATLCLACRQ